MPYDIRTAGPAYLNANPGNTNNPELIIAPDAIQKMPRSPSSFLKPRISSRSPIYLGYNILSISTFPWMFSK